ncbi:MAG: hypothetical protein A2138_23895 [Deltaproteobacteria bacterium RBG_16_71_12]|nr:MAG: hypothetical protein A2138_23895 [Deltaproteobacteria bacterium RBG_16_71_12]
MRFLDRADETARLDRVARSAVGGLAVVWGRRRVGKTRLLVEWCGRRGGLYVVADQSAPALQRAYLAAAASDVFPGFADATYPDWASLFRRIAAEAKQRAWRGPLVVDELPYLVQTSPELPSVLQRFVDHDAKEARLTVVVAGSSQRMMQGLVLDATAPLFGRAREHFSLEPLGAGWLREAFAGLSPRAAVEHFAVWGGLPHYWDLARAVRPKALARQLDALVLDPAGPLHREPDQLLLEEQPPATALRPILDAIGLGAHRLSEIASRVGVPATSLSRPLQRLIELGLVERETPFGESEKGQKRSLYQLRDPFFRMWFRVVAAHRSQLARAPAAARIALWRKHRDGLIATTWERLCREAVPKLRLAGLPHFGPASRSWYRDGPEWDMVALSLDGGHALVGEAKWHARDATDDDLTRTASLLRKKGRPPGLAAATRVHQVAFFPSVDRGRSREPIRVVDAGAVLDALR